MTVKRLLLVFGACAMSATLSRAQSMESAGDPTTLCPPAAARFPTRLLALYRSAAAGANGELRSRIRSKLRLEGTVPDSLVTLETNSIQCSTARAVYAAHFQLDSLDGAVVVRVDTMRAIVRMRYRAPGALPRGEVTPHLMTSASFAVADTLWY